jgi:predicted ArsR family transcriptional regulator
MSQSVAELPVDLDRDTFLRSLVRELAGILQDVVGVEEASGYLSVVGRTIGAGLDQTYRQALRLERLSRAQVGAVLVDLKRRINGDFYIIEETEDRIVLGNRRCPFAEKVIGRPAMCMMTSNVFGHIAAENLGYGKVELQRTIAGGDSECRVVVYVTQSPEAAAADGRAYFRSF